MVLALLAGWAVIGGSSIASFLLIGGAGVVAVLLLEDSKKPALTRLANRAWVLLGTVGILLTLGDNAWLQFAEPWSRIRGVSALLDFRALSGLGLMIAVAAQGVADVFDEALPDTVPLRHLGLSPPRGNPASLLEAAILPFEWLVFIVLRLLEIAVNAVWDFVVIVTKYVWMTVAAVAETAVDVLTAGENAVAIRKAVTYTGLFLGAAYVVSWAGSFALVYLRADTSIGSFGAVEAVALIRSFVAVGVVVAASALVVKVNEDGSFEDLLIQAAVPASALLATLTVAGFVLYGVHRFLPVSFGGFESLGVFSLAMSLLVAARMLITLGQRLAHGGR